jgi:hypothetical protein
MGIGCMKGLGSTTIGNARAAMEQGRTIVTAMGKERLLCKSLILRLIRLIAMRLALKMLRSDKKIGDGICDSERGEGAGWLVRVI